MKKHNVWKWSITLLIACSIVLSGCSNSNNKPGTPSETPTSENNAGGTTTPDSSPDPTDEGNSTDNPTATDSPDSATDDEKTDDLKVISDRIQKKMDLALFEFTGEEIKDMFYLDSSQYAEGVFKGPLVNIKSSDLAIIKLNDPKDFEVVKEALTKRAEDIIQMFSSYLPDQYEFAKNYQIVQEGDYVLYSISHDQEALLKIFKDSLK